MSKETDSKTISDADSASLPAAGGEGAGGGGAGAGGGGAGAGGGGASAASSSSSSIALASTALASAADSASLPAAGGAGAGGGADKSVLRKFLPDLKPVIFTQPATFGAPMFNAFLTAESDEELKEIFDRELKAGASPNTSALNTSNLIRYFNDKLSAVRAKYSSIPLVKSQLIKTMAKSALAMQIVQLNPALSREAKASKLAEMNEEKLQIEAETKKFSDSLEPSKNFLEGLVEVSAAVTQYSTPLHHAARTGCSKSVKFLLDNGADGNVLMLNLNGDERPGEVKKLITIANNPEYFKKLGVVAAKLVDITKFKTPLQSAIEGVHLDCIKEFITHGVVPTPLDAEKLILNTNPEDMMEFAESITISYLESQNPDILRAIAVFKVVSDNLALVERKIAYHPFGKVDELLHTIENFDEVTAKELSDFENDELGMYKAIIQGELFSVAHAPSEDPYKDQVIEITGEHLGPLGDMGL